MIYLGERMKTYQDKENKFIEMFNPNSGAYIRTGILEQNEQGKGFDTGVDPFMRDFPAIIDIGIMANCEHGKSGLCLKSGTQCYQDGLNIDKPNMLVEDFKSIIEQCKGKTFQVALGGRGDVNKHEHYEEILKICRDNGIVPNFTTSGFDLTDKEVAIAKKYCGAVAVSEYRNEYTYRAIEKFVKAGCITNLHYVLSKHSIKEAITKLRDDGFPEGIGAVIFLLHKPVGLGTKGLILDNKDPDVIEFFKLVDNHKHNFGIGFDSCTVPGILNNTKAIMKESLDTCEASRFSCYISAEMVMVPCSFDQQYNWGVDLKENTIKEAWTSNVFKHFRTSFKESCSGCSERVECYGGCPITPEIVLCNREGKNQKFKE